MENKARLWQKTKGNKQRVLLGAMIICVLAILAGGTLAYFIDIETAYNVITTGMIDMELKETTIDEHGNEVPWPEDGISGAMPGSEVAKKVWIENVGTESMYVRVKVTKKITPSELDIRYISLGGLNTTNWTLKDDYYYYNEAIKPGQKTEPLFESVEFDADMPNEYQECKVEIDVSAQAVQSKNNGATVFDAAGWPEA